MGCLHWKSAFSIWNLFAHNFKCFTFYDCTRKGRRISVNYTIQSIFHVHIIKIWTKKKTWTVRNGEAKTKREEKRKYQQAIIFFFFLTLLCSLSLFHSLKRRFKKATENWDAYNTLNVAVRIQRTNEREWNVQCTDTQMTNDIIFCVRPTWMLELEHYISKERIKATTK